jgi:preprotein translocase subunit SecF
MNILAALSFFGISVVDIPGLVPLLRPPLSIDFTGGVLMEVQFPGNDAPQPAEVVTLFNDLGIRDIQVVTTGDNSLQLRFGFPESFTDEQKAPVTTGAVFTDSSAKRSRSCAWKK